MKAVLLEDSTEALFDLTDVGHYVDPERRLTRLSKAKTRKLAEAVILQAIEDLWEPAQREESLEFFMGEGFEICSSIAGISYAKKLRLLQLVAESAPNRKMQIITLSKR
jgi:hypothetical protein